MTYISQYTIQTEIVYWLKVTIPNLVKALVSITNSPKQVTNKLLFLTGSYPKDLSPAKIVNV